MVTRKNYNDFENWLKMSEKRSAKKRKRYKSNLLTCNVQGMPDNVHRSTIYRRKIKSTIGAENQQRLCVNVDGDDNSIPKYIEDSHEVYKELKDESNENIQSEDNDMNDESVCNTDSCEVFDHVSDNEDMSSAKETASHEEPYWNSQWDNCIMFEASNISVREVLCMVQAMSLRCRFSDETKQIVLEFVKTLAGEKFQSFNTSKYTIAKIYNPPENIKSLIFFCPTCATVLNDPISKKDITSCPSAICENCSEKYLLTTSSKNWFLVLDLEYQIRSLLKNSDILRLIKKNIHDNVTGLHSQDINNLSDILKSKRYRECEFISEKNDDCNIALTLNVNIDGAPIFNTSKNSIWPIQCIINEIPVEFRFRHFLLASLWVVDTEPTPSLMNIYLESFVKQVKKLMNPGIFVIDDEGKTTKCSVKVFSFPVDSPARAIIQNRIQFNGYNGCSWCYMRGVYTDGSMKYLISSQDFSDRSHHEYLLDIENYNMTHKALKNPHHPSRKERTQIINSSRGSKGSSILTSLPYYDCIWGFPCEYMHSILLGVCKQLWEQWMSAKSDIRLHPWQKKIVETRLISIQPPHEIHRLPRLLKDRGKWRASEWRSWLLFYSVPCLNNVLPEQALHSYMLLIRATHILLRTNISQDELIQCKIDLLQFVGDCQCIYGHSFMTFNVHSLLHVVDSVEKNGPLWATSAFPFESNIGKMKQMVNGPKGVVHQIANHVLQRNQFQNTLSALPNDRHSWKFCQNIFYSRPASINTCRTNEGAILIGRREFQSHDNNRIEYNRCSYNNTIYHGTTYMRPNKSNNTYVQLIDATFLQIQYFTVDEQGYCQLNGTQLETIPFQVNALKLHHIHVLTGFYDHIFSVPLSAIQSKIVYVEVESIENSENGSRMKLKANCTDKYICMMPNTNEVQ